MAGTATGAPAAYFAAQLERTKDDLRRRGVEIFDFGVGDPLEPTPAFIRGALVAALDPVSQYPTIAGQFALRSAGAGWARRRLGVGLDPDTQVIPASGSKEAIFHLPLAILPPEATKRVVVYPTPSYPVYLGSARFAGAEPYPVALTPGNDFRLELAALPRSILERTGIAWINYPHNPTGAGVDHAYLARQVEVAREYDILLCADDCYLDVYFDESAPPPGLLQVTDRGILSFGSLSKRSGMTGYRSGYVAGDPDAIAMLKRQRPNFGVGSPNFIQAAAVAAWSDDAHVAERRAIFRAKRDRIAAFLETKGYAVTPGQGGIYLWAAVPVADHQSFFTRLLEHGIVVSPGESFGTGGDGFFRLALVPTLDQIDRALQAWDRISV